VPIGGGGTDGLLGVRVRDRRTRARVAGSKIESETSRRQVYTCANDCVTFVCLPARELRSIASDLMENEELAALRASYLATERLPNDRRAYQARVSEAFGDGADLVPYMLAASCSDPRDRLLRGTLDGYRLVAVASPPRREAPAPPAPTTSGSGAGSFILALITLALLWIAVRVALAFLLLS